MNCISRIVSVALAAVLVFFCLPFAAFAQENIKYGIGYVRFSDVKLYSDVTRKATVLDTAEKDDCVVILSKRNYWYKVIYNLQEGYMSADAVEAHTSCNAELGYGRINDKIVYIRSGPGTEYTLVSSGYNKDKEYYIIGLYDGWYKILIKSATCYVRSDLMDLTEIPYENADSEIQPQFYRHGETIGEITFKETKAVAAVPAGQRYAPVSGASLLAEAKKYIGTPYVYGGYSPDGFDCSGLIYYVLTKLGQTPPRTAADQYSLGYSVSRDKLQPGDLVFFNTSGGISHVGIYAGGGKFLHAPNSGESVCYSKLSGYWSSHYYGARRIG